MNIHVFFQNLNILCSFWSTGFYFWFFIGPVWFHIFGVDRSGLVSSSDNIDHTTMNIEIEPSIQPKISICMTKTGDMRWTEYRYSY